MAAAAIGVGMGFAVGAIGAGEVGTESRMALTGVSAAEEIGVGRNGLGAGGRC